MAQKPFASRRMAASKMTINQNYSWPVKLAIVIAVVGLGGALAMWTYDLGRKIAFGTNISPDQIVILKEEIAQIKSERDKLATFTNTIESQQNIEKTVQKQLKDQVNLLTAENSKMKDDLAFFESLMPSANRPQGVTLPRAKIEQVDDNNWKYRVLVMQGGKNVRDFTGELRISMTLVQNDKTVTMDFPVVNSGETNKLKLFFKHYQSLEGQLELPEGAVVKSALIKVMEKNEIRAKQLINFN